MNSLETALRPGSFPGGLFWLHHGHELPADPVVRLLCKAAEVGVKAALVQGASFDETLRDIVRVCDLADSVPLGEFDAQRAISHEEEPEELFVSWSWSRLEWTRVLTQQTGATQALYRRLNPTSHPTRMYDDLHEPKVIENRLLEDFWNDHLNAGIRFKTKREALDALEPWSNKRAYEDMLKRKRETP